MSKNDQKNQNKQNNQKKPNQTEAQRQAVFDAVKKRDAEKKQQKALEEKKQRMKTVRKAAIGAGAAAAVLLAAFGIRYAVQHSSGAMQKKVVAETEHYQVTASMLACYFKQCEESYLAYAAGDSGIAVFDESKPLRQQQYSETQSWFDMLMEKTIETVKTNLQLCEAAYLSGYSLSEEDLAHCREIAEQTEEGRYQKGVTQEDVRKTAEINILAADYRQNVQNSIEITDEQIRDYYDAHRNDYLNVSTLGYTFTWDPAGIVEGDYAEHDAAVKAAEELAKCTTQQDYSEYVFKYLTDRKGVERSDAEQIAGDLTITKNISEYPEELQQWVLGGAQRNTCTLLLHEEACSAQVYMLREQPAPDESKTVDIRILYLTAADYDGIENAVSFAEELKDQVGAAEDKSAEFASLAYEYSEDAETYPNGGLVSGYSASRTTYGDEVSAWAFDRERQTGDMMIAERTGAALLVFFEGSNTQSGWQNQVREDLYDQALSAFNARYTAVDVQVHEENYRYIK